MEAEPDEQRAAALQQLIAELEAQAKASLGHNALIWLRKNQTKKAN